MTNKSKSRSSTQANSAPVRREEPVMTRSRTRMQEQEQEQQALSHVDDSTRQVPGFLKEQSAYTQLALLFVLYILAHSDIPTRLAKAFTLTNQESMEQSDQNFAAIGAGMVTCMTYLYIKVIPLPAHRRSTPHVLFWDTILAIDHIYLMFVVYMLLLPVEQARSTLRIFDNDLGEPYLLGKSRETCAAFTPNSPTGNIMNGIWVNIWNIHFVAHLLGWYLKFIMCRDWYLIWVVSLSWEIMEVVMRQYQLNFWECWWDHMFLDLFGCNFVGIIGAYYTCKYFNHRMMAWVYDPRQYVNPTKPDSTVPWCLDNLRKPHWVGLSNIRKFLAASLFAIGLSMIDFNNFHLALTMRVPSRNLMLTYRVILYGINAVPLCRDLYENFSLGSKPMGPFFFLMVTASVVELMLGFKAHHHSHFAEVIPWQAKLMVGVLFSAWLYLFSIAYVNGQKQKRH